MDFDGPQVLRTLGNTGRYRLTGWLKRMLDRTQHKRLNQWVAAQLKEHEFIRVDPDARAKADAAARATADALWAHFKLVGEAAAYGRPPPPTPKELLGL